MSKSDVISYFSKLERKLLNSGNSDVYHSSIPEIQLSLGQCYYIIDYKSSAVISAKGIKEVLGYNNEDFNIKLLLDIIHPDDIEIISRLIRATLTYTSENDSRENVALYVTYRVRKINGDYIKILRKSSVYDFDESGIIRSALSVLTDITFMNLSDKIHWKFEAPGLNKLLFKKHIVKEYADFFSEREKDILILLNKSFNSKQIAEQLFISKHTVDTHRRKMLKKSGCKNTIELLNYSEANGIL